jgi:hypothetical protein
LSHRAVFWASYNAPAEVRRGCPGDDLAVERGPHREFRDFVASRGSVERHPWSRGDHDIDRQNLAEWFFDGLAFVE